jgi:FAD-dependent urate hydroxylase
MAIVKSAIVVGGGIAGPAAAMALSKAGIEPTIYEAYPANANTARIGGGFTIATNGLDALDAIDALGVTTGRGSSVDRISLYNSSGRLLGTLAELMG